MAGDAGLSCHPGVYPAASPPNSMFDIDHLLGPSGAQGCGAKCGPGPAEVEALDPLGFAAPFKGDIPAPLEVIPVQEIDRPLAPPGSSSQQPWPPSWQHPPSFSGQSHVPVPKDMPSTHQLQQQQPLLDHDTIHLRRSLLSVPTQHYYAPDVSLDSSALRCSLFGPPSYMGMAAMAGIQADELPSNETAELTRRLVQGHCMLQSFYEAAEPSVQHRKTQAAAARNIMHSRMSSRGTRGDR